MAALSTRVSLLCAVFASALLTRTAVVRAQCTQWEPQPAGPPPRPSFLPPDIDWYPYFLTLVHDSRRDVVVALGGYTGPQSAASLFVHEYDGVGWVRPFTNYSEPPRRSVGGATFDSRRNVLVMYGGYINNSQDPIDELWEYDGNAWVQRPQVGTCPPLTIYAPMTFDPYRGRTIVLAQAPSYDGTYQTWEWNGTVWERGPDLGPFDGATMAFVFDTWRNRGFLYAVPTSDVFEQTWEYTPGGTAAQGVWNRVPIGGAPFSGKTGAALVYDPYRGRIIRHGGKDLTNIYGYSPGTYLWDVGSSRWQLVDALGDGRAGAGICFDTARDRVVMYGGIRRYLDNEGHGATTNYVDLQEWIQRSPGLLDPTAPSDVNACVGGSATFAVTAAGESEAQYQWFKGADDIPGATGRILFLPSVGLADAGYYILRAANACGAMFSRWANLAVFEPVSWNGHVDWPILTCPGYAAFILPTSPSGTNVLLSLQKFDGEFWIDLAGQVTVPGGSFYLPPLQRSDSGEYRVATRNLCNSVVSPSRRIQVGVTFHEQPATQFVQPCDTAEFRVGAYGLDFVEYQWQRNGVDLVSDGRITGSSGVVRAPVFATGALLSSTLRIDRARYEDEGVYRCKLSDGCETRYSNAVSLSLPTPTWRASSPSNPPVRRYPCGFAYDAARNVFVMYGGLHPNGHYLNETWEYDGLAWTQRNPPPSPGRRSNVAMTYDSDRQTIVLWGGSNGEPVGPAYLADLWEYDGIDWVQRTATNDPGTRPAHVVTTPELAYDSVRKRVVLVRNLGNHAYRQSETWEYEAATNTWDLRVPANGFGGGYGGAMAYDPDRRVSIHYIDSAGGDGYRETWRWDGATWSKDPTTTPRLPFTYLAYDTVRRRTVAFYDSFGSSQVHTHSYFDTGSDWAPLLPGGLPDSPPEPWFCEGMGFDTKRRAMGALFWDYYNGPYLQPFTVYEYRYLDRVVLDRQPISQPLVPGAATSFEVVAAGHGELAYEWRRNGEPLSDGPSPGGGTIEGAAGPYLTIENVSDLDAGLYICLVSNACGGTVSQGGLLGDSSPDFDLDGDADLMDFLFFQNCFTGPGLPAASGVCARADLDNDQDVDDEDHALFADCLAGVGEPLQPNCIGS